jgi:hypothetical protein
MSETEEKKNNIKKKVVDEKRGEGLKPPPLFVREELYGH